MGERILVAALRALEPVADQLVVVGGTAHRLFLQHPFARDPGFDVLTTEDVDLAAPLELVHPGSTEFLDRLGAEGFRESVPGAEHATTVYVPEGSESEYLQFVTARRGDGRTRTGSGGRTMNMRGIHMEPLDTVDFLLRRPWVARIADAESTADVRVVHPSDFALQKLLIHGKRGLDERAKDVLYLHDTLVIFAEHLDELGVEAVGANAELSSSKCARARRVFAFELDGESSAIRRAARIADSQRGDAPDPELVASRLADGLPRLIPLLSV